MLDRILTPRGLAGIEYNNHFIRIDWSVHPIDSAFPHFKPRCLLGALTSNFQLKIYDTKERQGYSDTGGNARKKKNRRDRSGNGPERDSDEDSDEEEEEELIDEDEVSYHDGWVPVLDLTQIYNQILLKEWRAADGDFQHCRFSSYKDRLYQLAIVDFGWIEPWQTAAEGKVKERSSNLMTFHANGSLVIWRIKVQGDHSVKAEIVSRTALAKNQIVSAHKFIQISPFLGVLAVGFTGGHIKVYRVDRNENGNGKGSIISESKTPSGSSYLMQAEDEAGVATVWSEMDQLQVKFLDFVIYPSDNVTGQAPVLTLVAIKHPHHILSFKLHILPERIIWEEMNLCQSTDGHIVSLSKHSTGIFMVSHENGKLGFLEIQNSFAYYISESSTWIDAETEEGVAAEESVDGGGGGDDEKDVDEGDYLDSNKIHSKDPNYTCLWIYYGFALSPNGALALSSKGLRKTHDTILIKEASSCTFLSIFPAEDAWPYVKEKFEEHNFSLQKIPDVLHGFRFQLRLSRDYDLVKYREGRALDEMTLPELKLYLWVIRAMGIPKSWNLATKAFLSFEDISHITITILRETALTQEAIIEKHLTQVMEKVFASEVTRSEFLQSTKNLQSASAILQYLRSKPLSGSNVPAEFQVPVEPPLPICSSCDEEISFEYNKAFDPLKGITEPGIPGCKWNGQTCFNQHPNAVCILSLIPLDFPNRACPFCGCAALMEPAFDQEPFCPFCEEFLRSHPEETDDVDNEAEEENAEAESDSELTIEVNIRYEDA